MESSSYESLNQKKIIDLFIEGDDGFPYQSLSDIEGLHKELGNFDFERNGRNGMSISRNVAMNRLFNYLHYTGHTLDFLNDYILNSNVEQSIIDEFINKINSHLRYSDLEIIREGDIITSNKESDFSLISSDIEIDDDLRTLIDKAKEALKSKDYASVMTKSKSIVESEFKNILERKNFDYENNCKNMHELREAVNENLSIAKNGNLNRHVNNLITGINKSFDSLISLRNSFSDSHGGNDYSKIKKAEATLALNAAVSLSEYYENIYERQQKKLS